MPGGRIDKTVFISYRRTNSYQALAIYQQLAALGYDVFYDVESLRGGDWKQAILENIRARAHFLIVLTPSAVERFSEPNDIMRLEIETAMQTQRNIIPLFFDDFDFRAASPHLTGLLANLSAYNGLPVPTRYFKFAMQELHEQRLQQDIDTILHPVSAQAQRYADQQQAQAKAEPKVSEKQLTASEYFERAYKAAEEQRYDDAIRDYTEAIRLNPQDAKAYNNRGSAYDDKRDYDAAIRDYTEAIRLNPLYAKAYVGRAAAYINGKKDYDAAIRDANEAIRLNPQDANAYYNRGLAYRNKGDYDAAIRDYNEAIRLNPQSASAYNNRAWICYLLRMYDQSLADSNRSLQIDSKSAATLDTRGAVYQALGDYERALVDLDLALSIEPENVEIQKRRQEVLDALNKK